jgi:exopolyphosphatase/guanosine-5'-triphosphate,3'-diphosphate pyrophosphatase
VLFEKLAPLHGLAPADRDVLWAAAMLHSVGRFVAKTNRHKHGAYLIRNSPLEGWRDDERELIAQVARYHRRSLPKPSHPEYVALAPAERARVDALAALLRLADGLDATHQGAVGDIVVRAETGRITIAAQAESDVSGELAAAMEKADLFERAFGVRVAFEAAEGARA